MANGVAPETDGASIAEETLLSRWRFVELCVASVVGTSLLGLAGCGGSQDDSGGGDNGKKDKGGGGY